MTTYFGIQHLDRVRTSTVCLDTETTGLQPTKGGLRLLQLGDRMSGNIVIIDCWQLSPQDWDVLTAYLVEPSRTWFAHNASFDVGWLQEQGIFLQGKVLCSFIASRLLTNGLPNIKHGLDAVVKRYLGRELSKEQQRSDWSAPVLSEEQLDYAAEDIRALMDLYVPLQQKLAGYGLSVAYSLECRAIPAIAAMWRCGLPWDREALEQRMADYEFDIEQLAKEFVGKLDEALPEEHKLPRDEDGSFNLRATDEGSIRLGTKRYRGFNLNSPKQLIEKFTVLLGQTPIDPKKGTPSASRGALRQYAADHEVVQTYLAWKKAEKRRQMCVSILDKIDPDGFVRPSYMQLGADTGRMSCIRPNCQQVPRDPEFRSCVVAPDGWKLVDADFSGMELRLLAAVSDDPVMIKAFQADEDLHQVTADLLGCSRQVAKSANFGLAYGSGAKGLRDYAGATGLTMTLEEADKVRKDWLGAYQGVAEWQRERGEQARATEGNKWAEVLVPGTNMRRYLPGDLNRLTVRANTPIQGAGAAILKASLASLWPLVQKAGEDTVRIAAVVHDEILLLARDGHEEFWAETLKRVMEKAESTWLGDVPAKAEVSVGQSWDETH